MAYLLLSIHKDNWSKIFIQAKRYLSNTGKQGAPLNLLVEQVMHGWLREDVAVHLYCSFSGYIHMLFLSPVAC